MNDMNLTPIYHAVGEILKEEKASIDAELAKDREQVAELSKQLDTFGFTVSEEAQKLQKALRDTTERLRACEASVDSLVIPPDTSERLETLSKRIENVDADLIRTITEGEKELAEKLRTELDELRQLHAAELETIRGTIPEDREKDVSELRKSTSALIAEIKEQIARETKAIGEFQYSVDLLGDRFREDNERFTAIENRIADLPEPKVYDDEIATVASGLEQLEETVDLGHSELRQSHDNLSETVKGLLESPVPNYDEPLGQLREDLDEKALLIGTLREELSSAEESVRFEISEKLAKAYEQWSETEQRLEAELDKQTQELRDGIAALEKEQESDIDALAVQVREVLEATIELQQHHIRKDDLEPFAKSETVHSLRGDLEKIEKDIRGRLAATSEETLKRFLEDDLLRSSLTGAAGKDGATGKDGKDGAGIRAAQWEQKIYREGSTVTHHWGQFFTAKCDTQTEPGDSDDWERVGLLGHRFRGTRPDESTLKEGDLYIDGGSLFGIVGGQPRMVVQRGQRGPEGKRGLKGIAGERGKDGAGIAEIKLHEDMLYFALTDGSVLEASLEHFKGYFLELVNEAEEKKREAEERGVPIRTFLGDFDLDKKYQVGDVVRTGRYFYLCELEPPIGSLSSDFWTKFGGGGGGSIGGTRPTAVSPFNVVGTNLLIPRAGAGDGDAYFSFQDGLLRIWDATNGKWIFPGAVVKEFDHEAGASAGSDPEGSLHWAKDTGALWIKQDGGWVKATGGKPIGRIVADAAARLALRTPNDVITGSLVIQQDTGWTYRFEAPATGRPITDANWKIFSDFLTVQTKAERNALLAHALHPNTWVGVVTESKVYRWTGNTGTLGTDNGWQEVLTIPTDLSTLQRQVFDPEKPAGDQLEWVDDRDALIAVPDQNGLLSIPITHLTTGKLVYEQNSGKLYEFVASSTALSRTMSDWKEAGGGGGASVRIVNRAADLPLTSVADPIKDGDLALVRHHADGVTLLNELFIARVEQRPPALSQAGRGSRVMGDGNPLPAAAALPAIAGLGNNYAMYLPTDPAISVAAGGAATVAADQTIYVQYSDGSVDEISVPAGNYADVAALHAAGNLVVQSPQHQRYSYELGADGHTYFHVISDGSPLIRAYPWRAFGPFATAVKPPSPVLGAGFSWVPVSERVFQKSLKAGPDVQDPQRKDLQLTTEAGHKEIKVWDQTAGRWIVIYSEDDIASAIAAGNLFTGTAQEAGHGTVGAIDLAAMPSESSLGATDKGHYWVFVGTPGHAIGATEIGGAASAVAGQVLNVGDWIQVSEPTTGTYQYSVIPGDLLSKATADSLFGLNTWLAGAYQQGTLISHQGAIYKAGAAILATDPAPDDATNTKWVKIPLTAGVHNVPADNNLPPNAPLGDVYLVLNSAMAGGGPAFYVWDTPSGQWLNIGGSGGTGGTGQPMNLMSGEWIYNVGVPIGTVLMWPVDTPPNGFLICNGNAFDGRRYPILYQLLGDNHVPDLQGQFIRGASGPLDNFAKHQWTTGSPRNAFRTDNDGSHTHRYQSGAGSHQGIKFSSWSGGEIGGYIQNNTTGVSPTHTHGISGGDPEGTAPDHVILQYIIKAEDQNLAKRII